MERPLERVVIVGSGNLAEALAQAVARSGLQLVQLFARNAAQGEAVAALAGTQWTADPARLADADIYLISVSDKAVGEVAAALPLPAGAVVAHTAGSVPLDALPAHARRAVFYPLQTFTKGRSVDFSQIPLFLETDDSPLRPALEAFARRLSHTVVWADSACRAKVHLAAVFACNFVNHMYAVGEGIVRSAGLPFDVLKPLLAETAAKALDAASPADVQTGPAVRNALRQRIRWAKGHLQAFAETGWPLWKHVFTSHDAPTAFMSYDMFLLVCPRALWSIFTYAARLLCAIALWLFTKESFGVVGAALLAWAVGFGKRWLRNAVIALYVFLTERRHMPALPWYRKLWFAVTFPLFDVIGRISTVIALFSHVDWKPIPHDCAAGIDEMQTAKTAIS